MSFGKNLQFLRRLRGNMTQEDLAEKLNVSRQTISKWELDSVQPEIDKAIELCKLFSCTLDNLFREDMSASSDAYTDLRVETVPAFRYIKHAVIS
ncbi:MAG: helix-turn-helix domain-containing protein, partial [Oscillospiraceae bacterium]|nr:helix-turn-helix domain-containing protein [Oscillospiraceae bacterium]